jgi:hypothetical protein
MPLYQKKSSQQACPALWELQAGVPSETGSKMTCQLVTWFSKSSAGNIYFSLKVAIGLAEGRSGYLPRV